MTISWFAFVLGVNVDTVRFCQVTMNVFAAVNLTIQEKSRKKIVLASIAFNDLEGVQPFYLKVWVLQTANFLTKKAWESCYREKCQIH